MQRKCKPAYHRLQQARERKLGETFLCTPNMQRKKSDFYQRLPVRRKKNTQTRQTTHYLGRLFPNHLFKNTLVREKYLFLKGKRGECFCTGRNKQNQNSNISSLLSKGDAKEEIRYQNQGGALSPWELFSNQIYSLRLTTATHIFILNSMNSFSYRRLKNRR